MRLINLIIITCLALGLGACSTANYRYQNRDKAYLKARSIAPTKIPTGVAQNGFKNFYPVSMKHYPESKKHVSLVPPGLKGAA